MTLLQDVIYDTTGSARRMLAKQSMPSGPLLSSIDWLAREHLFHSQGKPVVADKSQE
jgi:hypothetical protein